MDSTKKKACFIHPDLGIGGAERLVVDAALALQINTEEYSDVQIYTSHCDLTHCFEEIKNGQLKVKVIGDFLPASIRGKFKILFSIIRQLYLSLVLILTGEIRQYDVIILDQLSFSIPLLHLMKKKDAKLVFYIHFPDMLLASHSSLIKKTYRWFFDYAEELTTSCADLLIVNSKFTKSVVQSTFKSLKERNLHVLYPCIPQMVNEKESKGQEITATSINSRFILSINRFERKKNIELAIDSFHSHILKKEHKDLKLVIAGGYDPNNMENSQYLNELQRKSNELKISSEIIHKCTIPQFVQVLNSKTISIIYLPSISTELKNFLLQNTQLLLYTPEFEHFGIVPIEAMSQGKLVLACNSGGPLETIVNYFTDNENFTGFTVPSDAARWTEVLDLVQEKELVNPQSCQNCLNRVDEFFSFDSFSAEFRKLILEAHSKSFQYETLSRCLMVAVVVIAYHSSKHMFE